MSEVPNLLEHNSVADALCAARDAVAALDSTLTLEHGRLLDRDAVLALLRTHIDHEVFGGTTWRGNPA